MSGTLSWGQAGEYDAIDDRAVITALAAGQRGLLQAPTLAPGGGLEVVIGEFLGIFDAGDGTAVVARNAEPQEVEIAAGPATGARTDILWLDLDPDGATWEINPRSAADTVGLLGWSLGRVTMPAGANTIAEATLDPVRPDYGLLIGEIKIWPTANPPVSWFPCFGYELDRLEFPRLFEALGGVNNPWGNPSGATFRIPNLGNRVLLCNGGREIAQTGGAETHALSGGEMPGHQHGGFVGDRQGHIPGVANLGPPGGGTGMYQRWPEAILTIPFEGNNFGHNNMQPYVVVSYIIKADH
jgi:microcystin-dependent protein